MHDQEIINIGHVELEVVHTPGHSEDSICLIVNKAYNHRRYSIRRKHWQG